MSTEVPGRDIDNKHQPNRDGNNAGLPYASESASALFTQHDTSPPSSLLQLRAQSHTGTVSQTVSPHDPAAVNRNEYKKNSSSSELIRTPGSR